MHSIRSTIWRGVCRRGRWLRASVLTLVPLTVLAADAPIAIDQITDVGATAASGMFSFAPDYLAIDPGHPLRILNSTGAHTVHSVPELWPEGVAKVAIAHTPSAEIVLDQPGLYGFTCARHGRYGMVMLIAVGEPETEAELAAVLDSMRAAEPAKVAFAELFERHRAAQ